MSVAPAPLNPTGGSGSLDLIPAAAPAAPAAAAPATSANTAGGGAGGGLLDLF